MTTRLKRNGIGRCEIDEAYLGAPQYLFLLDRKQLANAKRPK